jgi:predicted XRE-type DNA-binding protein
MATRTPIPDKKVKPKAQAKEAIASSTARSTARKPVSSAEPNKPRFIVRNGSHTVAIEGTSVFEQLGYSTEQASVLLCPVVDEVLRRRNGIKDALVDCLESIAKAEQLNITQMAERLAITRPRLSSIMNRDFERVSIDAVVDVIHRFGRDVKVQVVDARAPSGATASKSRRNKTLSVAARA